MESSVKPEITFEQFSALDLRVGKVSEAQVHPNADRLLVVQVDMGDHQRQLVAGLKQWYEPEDLVGKTVVVLINLKPRTMRGVESQGMLLAAIEGDPPAKVVALTLDRPIVTGAVVS